MSLRTEMGNINNIIINRGKKENRENRKRKKRKENLREKGK